MCSQLLLKLTIEHKRINLTVQELFSQIGIASGFQDYSGVFQVKRCLRGY